MKSQYRSLILSLVFCCCFVFIHAQEGPPIWIFGKQAGLDFNSGQAVPVSYPVDNCYSPTSSQSDAAGNLLFYCDGRDIKNRNGQVMPGSLNPVWQPPVHIVRKIESVIVPVLNDTNRYYVFMLSPSSGEPPFGTYYSGVLTYSIVDMRLNNGLGGVDPAFSNLLLNTELDQDMIVVPGANCNYWLITYRRLPSVLGTFQAYEITGNGIAAPVVSSANLAGFPYSYYNMQMVYAYQYHKIVAWLGGRTLFMMDFDHANGMVSNAKALQDLLEFRSQGGGVTTPSVCLSRNEKYLYILGYPMAGTGPNGPEVRLRQYPVDFTDPNLTLPVSASSVIFETTDAFYQVPGTSLPYASSDCDMRRGPDGKVYLFYNTGQSFLGVINQPDLPGLACNHSPQGLQLLPNTFGSFCFPAVAAERFSAETRYRSHDTLLCFSEPFRITPGSRGDQFSYEWSDGSTLPYKEVTAAGTYWVKSTGGCGDDTEIDTFVVRFKPAEQCYCTMFIPNAFSPNHDNLNDVFKPMLSLSCMNGGYRMMIYNRWGEKVFQSFDILKGWDGTKNGEAADLGVYYYTIRYTDQQGKEQSYKGDFSLLR